MNTREILERLKKLQRLDVHITQCCDECGPWQEQEYNSTGEYIRSNDLDDLITRIENAQQ